MPRFVQNSRLHLFLQTVDNSETFFRLPPHFLLSLSLEAAVLLLPKG